MPTPDFVSLPMSHGEFELLVRLLGHHTSGEGLGAMYERLVDLRKNDAVIAENKGPLAMSTPLVCRDLYGERPVVKV